MAVDLKHYRRMPEGDDLRGHEWERANKCAKCLGTLRSGVDGHYHSTGDLAAICCGCKGGECGKARAR